MSKLLIGLMGIGVSVVAVALSAAASLADAPPTAQVDVAVQNNTWEVPGDLKMRARVTEISPAGPASIAWRYGGESMGGTVVRGDFSSAPALTPAKEKKKGKSDAPQLATGQWTDSIPITKVVGKKVAGEFFLTITIARANREPSTKVHVEVEFSSASQVIKTLAIDGPDGGTVGLVIPFNRLAGGKSAKDPEFLAGLLSILDYARLRADQLEHLPWAAGPLPKKFAMMTDLGGYGAGVGYGIRHCDPAIVETECRSLHQLGVNGLRAAPEFLLEKARKGEGYAAEFNHAVLGRAPGYPVEKSGKGKTPSPDAGCPFGPEVAQLTKEDVADSMSLFKIATPQVWALTVDEIGSVFDRASDKKSHVAHCDRCAAEYQKYLQTFGVTPADFGKAGWQEIRPLDLAADRSWQTDAHAALNAYYTRRFICYASARLFTPLRTAIAGENAKKQAALDSGPPDSPEAKQPWVYTYALRGNTFLMGGHSLDFFEFYRSADNAFVYEMSNRDPRVWQWDSYLCDVGRSISAEQGLAQGIYVKPHRGAPVQRALTAISRGARMIYWYTYGPDYFKGDSFSSSPEALALTSKAAHLIGKAEDALYGAKWARPAEVAIVKPLSLEIWQGLTDDPASVAAWEDAKWTYTALAHAHIPVDAIDETMLATGDLSRYRVIYIPSPNLSRAAAAKVADWVKAGGILHTSCGGLSRDEADQPLETFRLLLGLEKRQPPEMWCRVPRYKATSLASYSDAKAAMVSVPAGAVVTGSAPFSAAPVTLKVGREILLPSSGTTVLAHFADGGAAATRNDYGKGHVYVLGFFAGLEYAAPLVEADFDMSIDFNPTVRSFIAVPALSVVAPVVQTSIPAVEGVLLQNKENGLRSITLMNWGYRTEGKRVVNLARDRQRAKSIIVLPTQKDLKITVRGAGPVKEARSVWLDKPLPVRVENDAVSFTLPELAEGDVIVLK